MRENTDAVDVRDRVIDTLEWIHGHSDEELYDLSVRVRMRQLMNDVKPADLSFAHLTMVTAMVGGAHARMLAREGWLPAAIEAKFRPIGGEVGAVIMRAQRLNTWLEAQKPNRAMFEEVSYRLGALMDHIGPDDLSPAEVTTIAALLGPVHGRLLLAAGGQRPTGGPSLRLLTFD